MLLGWEQLESVAKLQKLVIAVNYHVVDYSKKYDRLSLFIKYDYFRRILACMRNGSEDRSLFTVRFLERM